MSGSPKKLGLGQAFMLMAVSVAVIPSFLLTNIAAADEGDASSAPAEGSSESSTGESGSSTSPYNGPDRVGGSSSSNPYVIPIPLYPEGSSSSYFFNLPDPEDPCAEQRENVRLLQEALTLIQQRIDAARQRRDQAQADWNALNARRNNRQVDLANAIQRQEDQNVINNINTEIGMIEAEMNTKQSSIDSNNADMQAAETEKSRAETDLIEAQGYLDGCEGDDDEPTLV